MKITLPRAAVWLLGLSIAFHQSATIAEVYKCTDATGELSFSDTPCPSDSQSVNISPKQPPFNPEDYCQVVFEADYTGKYDRGGEKTLQVRKGEKMLAGGWGGDGKHDRLFYLTDAGVVDYDLGWMGLNWLEQLPGRENKPPPPHHSTCQSTEVLKNGWTTTQTVFHMKLLVVLHDVNLYLDEELKQFACRLTAGTTQERGDERIGVSVGDEIGSLEMDTLPEICNGHSQVYFKTKKTPAGAASPLAMFLWKLKK